MFFSGSRRQLLIRGAKAAAVAVPVAPFVSGFLAGCGGGSNVVSPVSQSNGSGSLVGSGGYNAVSPIVDVNPAAPVAVVEQARAACIFSIVLEANIPATKSRVENVAESATILYGFFPNMFMVRQQEGTTETYTPLDSPTPIIVKVKSVNPGSTEIDLTINGATTPHIFNNASSHVLIGNGLALVYAGATEPYTSVDSFGAVITVKNRNGGVDTVALREGERHLLTQTIDGDLYIRLSSAFLAHDGVKIALFDAIGVDKNGMETATPQTTNMLAIPEEPKDGSLPLNVLFRGTEFELRLIDVVFRPVQ